MGDQPDFFFFSSFFWSFGLFVLQPPLPLQSFFPLQSFLAVLQPPRPLQSFLPAQSCLPFLASSLAGVPAFWSAAEAWEASEPAYKPATAAMVVRRRVDLFMFRELDFRWFEDLAAKAGCPRRSRSIIQTSSGKVYSASENISADGS